ncbi:MAG TPA: hypothetical protein VF645_05355 [Allosphingosinicella sp.]|jgi:hypothetical protein
MRIPAFRAFGFAFLSILLAAPAVARAPSADDSIRQTLSRWYEELARRDEGRPQALVTPGFIDASPAYYHAGDGSRALGPRVYDSLTARALKFRWEVTSLRRDSSFAKVQVWERGYFYAAAARKTYELAAATTFVLERSEKDGRWLIAAHRSSGQGIPPNRITDPMPDLRALYYSTEGKDRDPAADARAARIF